MMTEKTEPVLRDAAILIVAVVACALIGLFGTNELISEKWRVVGFAIGGFTAQILVKVLMPNHSIQRLFGWSYLLATMTLVCVALVLLSDWSLLGAWTLPAVAGFGVLGLVVHLKLVRKTGDARRLDSGAE